MRHLILLVAAATATVVAASALASGGPAAGITSSTCQSWFGSKSASLFAQRFGSEAGCEREVLPLAQAALAACTSLSTNDAAKSCFESQFQAALKNLGGKPAAVGGGPQPVPSAAKLAASTCQQWFASKSSELFAKRFGSEAGCEGEVQPLAAAALSACVGSSSNDAVKSCFESQFQAALKSLNTKSGNDGGQKGGGGAVPSAAKLAASTCQSWFGSKSADQFAKRFGSESGCEDEVRPLAAAALVACSGLASNDAVKSCFEAQYLASLAVLGKKK